MVLSHESQKLSLHLEVRYVQAAIEYAVVNRMLFPGPWIFAFIDHC